MNPFLKRATEHLTDPEGFLGLVSPEPLGVYLQPFAEQGALYDRLVIVEGTPGSGKTTIARMFTLPVIAALLRHAGSQFYRPTLAALSDCLATTETVPLILGHRVPFEPAYREIWELPYPDAVKFGLTRGLIQARAVLGWFRSLRNVGVELTSCELVVTDPESAAVASSGAGSVEAMLERARSVERKIYETATGLVPPTLKDLDADAIGSYRPFDVIKRITCKWPKSGDTIASMLPLVILDDTHELHSTQFADCRRWLMRRELRVARWMLCRLDILSPTDVLISNGSDPAVADLPGVTSQRDFLPVRMQGIPGSGAVRNRRKHRTDFRRMVRDMSERYLRTMPTFSRRGLGSLASLLEETATPLSPSKNKKLRSQLDAALRRAGLTQELLAMFEADIEEFCDGKSVDEAVRMQMLSIIAHRYLKHQPQGDLFSGFDDVKRMPTVSSGVRSGAELQLLHEVNRAYYFGFEMLADASGENVEQFLRLAGCLVEAVELKIIRRNSTLSISAVEQNKLLRERAKGIVADWQFPRSGDVRLMLEKMAQRCREKSLEKNASLGAGANAFGVLQVEFDAIPQRHPRLANVLQYAVAYNAINIVPRYPQGNKDWCLLEICGPAILAYGLTLHRGGFIESSSEEIASLVWGEER